ncbi:dynein axonemal intermediate chain 1-like [Oratosquilla oratoria]|uniref:dynein axonemal intermediate chain 1-like n=1 Tax=Oratosquilla oratoria TaxID=337810 RepID=UPI003F75DEDF
MAAKIPPPLLRKPRRKDGTEDEEEDEDQLKISPQRLLDNADVPKSHITRIVLTVCRYIAAALALQYSSVNDSVYVCIATQQTKEPEVEIRLTTVSAQADRLVRYDFRTGQYELVPNEDLTEDLLTLPSRIVHRDEVAYDQTSSVELQETAAGEGNSELEELYEGVVSKAELALLDSQPNPFNFSERVSQTAKIITRDLAIQTEPPPSTTFSRQVSLCEIYDAYQKDYEKVQEKEKEKKKEKEQSNATKQSPRVEREAPHPPPVPASYGDDGHNLRAMASSTQIIERMVNQNIYDEIAQDFKYWEDGSDEFRPLEGSLLPLWKFNHDKSRTLVVSALSWSPVYPDLFAASYMPGDMTGPESEGMLCLFTLKNPSSPERVFKTNCGITYIQFHPKVRSVLVTGQTDGNVVVYDVRTRADPTIISSSINTGKHLLPVLQVKWIPTEAGSDLSFFSLGMDGRVRQWFVHRTSFTCSDVLAFPTSETKASNGDKEALQGTGTCLAFHPDDHNIFLVGTDKGTIYQGAVTSTTTAFFHYVGHTAPVRALAWNHHHAKVFISCAADWTVKVWLQYHRAALIVLDLGGPVAEVVWAPYSSSVAVAATEDGKVHVYDLFVRKCRPLCVQNIVQRRKVTLVCVAFNRFHPIILVGGHKGHLVTLKLSPNLRKPHKDAKGADEQRLKEIEIGKIERLIAISRG